MQVGIRSDGTAEDAEDAEETRVTPLGYEGG